LKNNVVNDKKGRGHDRGKSYGKVMTGHLTLFVACFSVIYSRI